MASHEEKAVEDQLELQLKEQRDSLSAIDDALASDPSNEELLSVQEELLEAIKDAEEGLLSLKRARLLREVHSALDSSNRSVRDDFSKAEPTEPGDVHVDVEAQSLEDRSFSIGSKCRFRYTDGRWYNGLVVGLEGSDSAKVSFLTPTCENMLICKFFMQQRCRFGSSCRLSHGVDVPLSSLKEFVPTIWEKSMVGSSIWAVSDIKGGIWKEAELLSLDDEHNVGEVIFRENGNIAQLGTEALALSEYAQIADHEDVSDVSTDVSDSSDYEEDRSEGLGFLGYTALQRGIQTETTIFATWENHTRGVASKMMANMGYREGMGLGASGQGMLNPISVKARPPKQSLGHAEQSREHNDGKENKGKKRSRGGRRKREKKFATAARAARDENEARPDVFNLINTQLAMQGEVLNGGSAKKQDKVSAEKKVNRRALVAYDDKVKDLKMRVVKLEEMVSRNRREKAVYEAALRKLNETREALANAEAAQASALSALAGREKEKKLLKF